MRKLIPIFFLLIFFSCGSKSSDDQNYPIASKGVIDFTHWDFERNGNVLLNGEWEFYWNELLTPNDLEKNNLTPSWVQVPNPWNVYLDKNEKLLPANGFATYRLKIIAAPNQKKLCVRLTEIRDAYSLWIDNDLIITHGKVGKSKAAMIPRSDANLTTIELENGQTEIVLQVSNFRSSKAGFIRKSILLGTESNIQNVRAISIGSVLFLIGCYLIIGISHLYFFQMRRQVMGALYFSIICLLSMLRVLTTGDKLLIYWTNISTELNSKLAYLSTYFIVLFFFKYLKAIFPREISNRIVQLITWTCIALAAFIMVTPNEINHWTTPPFQGLLLLSTLFLLYALYLVLKRKRRGGIIFTIGLLIVIVAGWNDTFYPAKVTAGGYLFPFGILFFMLLQAFFLTKLFATSIDRMRKLSDTFRKFVPEQFLKTLDEKATNNIPLGLAREELLTISFSDIRSFSNISEQMTSQELLVFLNDYFKKMDAPIHHNYGFIDKYIGDSIMSIFDRKLEDENKHPSDAVKAGIGMQEVQQNHDEQHQTMFPIQFGVGIHTGKVILGTVGSASRMSSTVIGDAVNLASRLESLTKYYDAQIIISETTKELINYDDFHIRQLDKVVVKGKSNIVFIYEVFDANPFELKKMKVESSPFYEEGLKFYFEKKWELAIESFEKSLAVFPNDKVAKMYIERCEQFQKKAPPLDWQGEYIYEIK
ncbi:MAG: adenylate/guanylate cyclase domain-containing protein [Saprospiraceae bacterium]